MNQDRNILECASRRQFLQSLLGATVLGGVAPALWGSGESLAAPPPLPRPNLQQLAWQDCELGMFFHFDIGVYKPDWNWRSFKDLPQPAQYNPARLDTDQWLETAKSYGAKYAVFVAKHCTGFLQWQSDCYPYGVKQSPWRGGKGDIVKDFVASCHKYGIKPGIYASVSANAYFEVDNPGRVNRGKGGNPVKQARYSRICEQMLTELWSRYGELFHIWFDGGALLPREGGPRMLPLLEKYQPRANVFGGPAATIRWIGNEKGAAAYPCWATVAQRGEKGAGDPAGKIWLPGECDVPLPGHDWFWSPTQKKDIQPLDQLMDMYYRSVGHGCNLLLNATPGPDGLIPEVNLKHYADFGKEVRRRFAHPVGLTVGHGDRVELKLPRPAKIDHIVIMEDITQGQRIRKYRVEGRVAADRWETLCDGESIGHKRIQRIPPTEVAAVRLCSLESVAAPVIRSLAVYNSAA